ncbi:neprilysin-2-like [Stegodyphus dumicola]|uniref:neprilysin-2-like n=1 Tax=Stegodyphus dumicola TaxID=202533 RepID=UPI0015B28D8C|nr:neprilysin-2-like [Stegodyphus dumicola]
MSFKKEEDFLDKDLWENEPDDFRKVKLIYDSCMDTQTIEKLSSEPLLKVLEYLGGWPVLQNEIWNETTFDWINTISKIRQMGFNHNILMGLSVIEDPWNNSAHILELDQPSFGTDRKTLLNKEDLYLTNLYGLVFIPYLLDMHNAARKLALNIYGSWSGKDVTIQAEMEKVFRFEGMLVNFSLAPEERRNMSNLNKRYTVKQLMDEVKEIDWIRYFNELLDDEIDENETLIIKDLGFIKKFASCISKVDKKVVANYMMWRVVYESLPFLSKEYRNHTAPRHPYSGALYESTPRWKQCFFSLRDNLGLALHSYYMNQNAWKLHNLGKESKNSTRRIIRNIRRELSHVISNTSWIDNKTKTEAINKINAIKAHVGYPDDILYQHYVDNLYVNLTIGNECYFDIMMKVRKWAVDYSFSQLRKTRPYKDWKKHINPSAVKPYYNYLENSIDILTATLQHRFFNKDRPYYLKFGTIGYLAGSEIMRGFDYTGRQLDGDGNIANWWPTGEETDRILKKKSKCLLQQYKNYCSVNVDRFEAKKNDLGLLEDLIAHNAALKLAYKAYESFLIRKHVDDLKLPGMKYSPKQLFWISAASLWCEKVIQKSPFATTSYLSSIVKVVAPILNQADFAKDFQCPEGSLMNPSKKCEFW